MTDTLTLGEAAELFARLAETHGEDCEVLGVDFEPIDPDNITYHRGVVIL